MDAPPGACVRASPQLIRGGYDAPTCSSCVHRHCRVVRRCGFGPVDISKRLEPQAGTKLVYARTFIDAGCDEVRKLAIGYSDEVSVFLNGRILYRGRSAQYFRDPVFRGIVSADNDAVYLPLVRGRNELVLAVSELGGGWGFVCRLEQAANVVSGAPASGRRRNPQSR